MKIALAQKGQVLILGIFFTGVCILLTLMLFNTTQNEFERQQATNIADAAVYSSLQLQARGLNYLAYTNRAIIANHVSVGQIVSTASWLDYVSNTLNIIENITQFIPGIGPYIARGVGALEATVDVVVEQILPIALAQTQIAITALHTAQVTTDLTTSASIGPIVHQIVELNDSRYEANPSHILSAIYSWNTFTDRTRTQRDIDRQAQTISASRDQWAVQRNNRRSIFYLFTYYKYGSTQLTKVTRGHRTEWVWDAFDSATMRQRRIGRSSRRRNLTSAAYTTRNRRLRSGWGQQTRIGRTYRGLHHHYDLAPQNARQGAASADQDASLQMTLSVTLEPELIRTSETIDDLGAHSEDSIFYLQPPLESTTLEAVGHGEVYFQRPDSWSTDQREYSNLFNPFWLARLKQENETRREIRRATRLTSFSDIPIL